MDENEGKGEPGAQSENRKRRLGAYQFLKALFPKLERGEQIEIRSKRPADLQVMVPVVKQGFYPDVERAAHWAGVRAYDSDVYFGVCPRHDNDGTSEGVTRITAIWQDLDFKDGHDDESRRAQLHALGCAPSIVVHTGGGLHAYWLLREPFPSTQSEKARASALMRALAERLGADNVGDPARIMRLPGTRNLKYDPPRRVEIVGFSPGKRYTLEELQRNFGFWILDFGLDKGNDIPPGEPPAPIQNLKSKIQNPSALNVSEVLNGVPEGQRDITIFRLACKLRRAGIPEQMAGRLVMEAARNCIPPFPEKLALAKVVRAYKKYPAGPEERAELQKEREESRLGRIDEASGDEVRDEAGSEQEPPFLPFLGQSGYIVEGWSHLLAGYPRSGKSELLTRLCAEWIEAGREVVYITEEPRSIWRHRLARLGTLQSHDWSALKLVFALGNTPGEIFQRAFARPESVIVIDTMRNLLSLTDETDNSRLAQTLNPWVAAARLHGKTLIFAHHMRKGSGEYGEGIAGGHAMLGVFDIALELLRDDRAANRRRVRVYARLLQTPELVYDLAPDGVMRYLGDPAALRLQDVMERVRGALGASGEWVTTSQLREELGEPVPSVEQLRVALHHLADKGQIERDPPLTAGNVSGRTVRWRSCSAAQEDGPDSAA